MIRYGFGAKGCEAHIVVWLNECSAANTDCLCLLKRKVQLDFIGHAQHDEVTTLFRMKAPSSFQTGMTNLHDLIRDGQIGADQHVDMARGNLLVGHRKDPY